MILAICEDYLEWVRGQRCEAPTPEYSKCEGRIIAHHVTGRGMGGSKRDDRDAVPLCWRHHQLFHNKGELLPWTAEQTKVELYASSHKLLKKYMDEQKEESEMVQMLKEDIF